MSSVRNDERFGARLCPDHPQIRFEAREAARKCAGPSAGRKTSLRGSNAKCRGANRGGAPQKLKRAGAKGR